MGNLEKAPAGSSGPSPATKDSGSLVARVAFGAVLGTTISLLIKPMLALLPDSTLLHAFTENLVSELVSGAIIILLSVVAARMTRFDLWLKRHLRWASIVIGVVMAVALWLNAGRPLDFGVVISLVLTALVAIGFLRFCGEVLYAAMYQLTDSQRVEYLRLREEESRAIVSGAIAEGDPALAQGIFGLEAVGRWGDAMRGAIEAFLTSAFYFLAILLSASVAAGVLYGFSPFWSVAIGAIVSFAAFAFVGASRNLGEAFAEYIDVTQKYESILRR